MEFKKTIGVNSYGADVQTGEELTHEEIYTRAVYYLGGPEAVKPYIPFTVDEIRAALAKGDKPLNSLWLKKWERAAGFICKGSDCKSTGGGLWRLLLAHKINCISCSEAVCILKNAALMLAAGL